MGGHQWRPGVHLVNDDLGQAHDQHTPQVIVGETQVHFAGLEMCHNTGGEAGTPSTSKRTLCTHCIGFVYIYRRWWGGHISTDGIQTDFCLHQLMLS